MTPRFRVMVLPPSPEYGQFSRSLGRPTFAAVFVSHLVRAYPGEVYSRSPNRANPHRCRAEAMRFAVDSPLEGTGFDVDASSCSTSCPKRSAHCHTAYGVHAGAGMVAKPGYLGIWVG